MCKKLVIKSATQRPFDSKAEAMESDWLMAADRDRLRDIPDGTPVRIAVKVKKRWRLIPGFVGTWTDDCTCGVCDWVQIKVLVPRERWAAHLRDEAEALSFGEFWKQKDQNRALLERDL